MQRDRIELHQIAALDNLALAAWKAATGKRRRPAVARFLAALEANLAILADDILSERAPRGVQRTFVIHDPKRRTISAACFPDRVLHHAILNLAEPRFERMLVPTSFACRPSKGVHAAVMAVQRTLHRAEQWPWYVQVDIDGYFPSIDHEILNRLLTTRFKGDGFLRLLGRIIDFGIGHQGMGDRSKRSDANTPAHDGPPSASAFASVSGRRGLPIGALTSQHFANAYLDGADRLLLADPRVTAHARYMDDIAWWCRTRADANATLGRLRDYLWDERRLTIKPSVRIGRATQGLQFCGFRIRPGVVLASSRKLSRFRDATGRIRGALAAEAITEADAQRAGEVALATLAGCVTDGFRRRLLAQLGDLNDYDGRFG